MKWILLCFLIGIAVLPVFSQQVELSNFNRQRVDIAKRSMLVLGGWGAANVAFGAALTGNSTGVDHYFHQMNLVWGGINLGIAALGYWGARKENTSGFTSSIKRQHQVEKIFLFNAGLDLAYISTGLYLKEKAKSSMNHADRYQGYGQSFIMQGSALLLFDTVLFFVHHKHGTALYKIDPKLVIAATTNGIGCLVKL